MNNVLERAIKTFVEAAGAVLVANISDLTGAISGWETWRQVAVPVFVGALAAGISAVWNGVIQPALTQLKK